jgi:hypothetical protein
VAKKAIRTDSRGELGQVEDRFQQPAIEAHHAAYHDWIDACLLDRLQVSNRTTEDKLRHTF